LSYEIYEKRTITRIERHNILEAQQLEKLNARKITAEFIRLREIARDQDIKDIFGFDKEYSDIKKEYLESIAGISEELEEKVVNIDDIMALVEKRIAAAGKFKERLENIEYIPGPLEDFHGLLIFFLENDISTWEATRSYYAGDYDGSDSDLKRLHSENTTIYGQTEELQKEIYSSYGLEDLF
jgi:hypothetical protein